MTAVFLLGFAVGFAALSVLALVVVIVVLALASIERLRERSRRRRLPIATIRRGAAQRRQRIPRQWIDAIATERAS